MTVGGMGFIPERLLMMMMILKYILFCTYTTAYTITQFPKIRILIR